MPLPTMLGMDEEQSMLEPLDSFGRIGRWKNDCTRDCTGGRLPRIPIPPQHPRPDCRVPRIRIRPRKEFLSAAIPDLSPRQISIQGSPQRSPSQIRLSRMHLPPALLARRRSPLWSKTP